MRLYLSSARISAEGAITMTRLLPLLVCVSLFLVACVTARSLRTPDGTEVNVVCPPSLADADPGKLATVWADGSFLTPGVLSTLVPPEASNSLWTLMPVDSPDGSVWCCTDRDNASFGSPEGGGGLFGFGASEEQLDEMGRLCGGIANSQEGALRMRVDLYAATPGAAEAYKREADTMAPDGFYHENIEPDDEGVLSSIGDERVFMRYVQYEGEKPRRLDIDDYELLFRRRNIVARLQLSYLDASLGFPAYTSTPQKGPPEPLLEYATQLDQNIEAPAVAQQ
jgi:hypothetical protein